MLLRGIILLANTSILSTLFDIFKFGLILIRIFVQSWRFQINMHEVMHKIVQYLSVNFLYNINIIVQHTFYYFPC